MKPIKPFVPRLLLQIGRRLALLGTLATVALLAACSSETTPGQTCKTANQCGAGAYCVAAQCQELGTGAQFYADDPMTGDCRPVAVGSKDDSAARGWNSCGNPCAGLGEASCSAEPRCQPLYAQQPFNGCGGCNCPPGAACDCANIAPCPLPDNCPTCAQAGAPAVGVAIPADSRVAAPTSRSFVGCRPVAQPRTCDALPEAECGSHPECQPVFSGCGCTVSDTPSINAQGELAPQSSCPACDPKSGGTFAACEARSCYELGATTCPLRADCAWDGGSCKPAAAAPCGALAEKQCLGRRDCRAVGEACYCPPDMTCACGGGKFLSCEVDGTAPTCLSDSDCATGFSCDTSTCLPPAGCDPTGTAPCAAVCAGKCVAQSGCATLDEASCNATATCAPKYSEDCSQDSPYACGGFDLALSPPANGGAVFAGGSCGCTPKFAGCVDLTGDEIVGDRSLLIREPVVLDQAQYAFPAMLGRLAGGDAAPMMEEVLTSYTVDTTINGRVAKARSGVAAWMERHARRADGKLDLAHLGFRPMAIVNRIDLVSATSCGEARIVYANDSGVTDKSHRMTVIFEFGVPNDGQGCRSVAQRWATLSQFATGDPRFKARLTELTDSYFQPQNLNQLRTNELLNGTFTTDWELREFKLAAGHLVPQPCKNSPDLSLLNDQAFLSWVRDNQILIALGTAVVPETFLTPASVTDGTRFTLPSDLMVTEKALNAKTCNGCHSTETGTQFAHLLERRFSNSRAAASGFLRKDLKNRGQILKTLLGDSAQATVLRTRERAPFTH